MKTITTTVLIFTSLAILACGPDNAPKTTPFAAERNTLDKAKAMDKNMQQQTQEQQQNVDKQTQ